jgi:putative tricarboxylic transport membrane protein
MSETPPGVQAVEPSESIKKPRTFQVGLGLLAVAVVCGSIDFGWVPDFLGVPREVLIYVAEIVGLYALACLISGVIGGPGSPRDYWGGVALMALALFALEASRDLPGMRGFAFGPGTAPRGFAIVVGGLGLAVSITGVTTKGPGIDRFYIRGPLFVTLSVLLFALLVRPAGLVYASYLSICAAAGATPEARIRETLLWSWALTAFCCLLFYYWLNLPMQLCPQSIPYVPQWLATTISGPCDATVYIVSAIHLTIVAVLRAIAGFLVASWGFVVEAFDYVKSLLGFP